ncbi:hypothetical protein PAECIP111891_02846 [Paenibacillus allorhizoplanae]|uniref:DUF948 domain-containing protein n=1 Tax=Paenibacillus allorhizoplanae TaxID=2905648 RepID=A0ABM9C7R7_9BACL|nr:DUF948 domain-containing protein [Paenibacillus allorhizoplanae]CAH1206244.1 hypothetical protein PAECIP111891_02846 [Paenibacillus allorhizoplanae]
MLLQISVCVVAIAFVFLVFYLIQTLKSLKHSLDEITSTMGQMKNEVTEISSDVKDVILNTNEVAIDMRMKLSTLNHLFGTVQDVGQVLHELSSSVKQSASSLIASVKPTEVSAKTSPLNGKLKAILQGATMTLEIWDKIKVKKSSPPAGSMK